MELHKTGCTHIGEILTELFHGKQIGKHNQANPNLFTREKIFLGSVRNPWEWYISLWTYGCYNKGGLFHRVTKNSRGWRKHFATFLNPIHSKDSKKWKKTYSNVNDANAFRLWLRMIHDLNHTKYIGEGYSDWSASQFCGLMTFRYLRLFCGKLGELEKLNQLSTFEQVKDYENKNCFIDCFIRNESLETDLFLSLEKHGVLISSETKSKIMSKPKTNTSFRKYSSEYYYDAESKNIVSERERLIIDKFRYLFPRSGKNQC